MSKARRFTGWHMTTILVAFFAVVITVNIVMARFALSTFGGAMSGNTRENSGPNVSRRMSRSRSSGVIRFRAFRISRSRAFMRAPPARPRPAAPASCGLRTGA